LVASLGTEIDAITGVPADTSLTPDLSSVTHSEQFPLSIPVVKSIPCSFGVSGFIVIVKVSRSPGLKEEEYRELTTVTAWELLMQIMRIIRKLKKSLFMVAQPFTVLLRR
jgi:hypothetical protein